MYRRIALGCLALLAIWPVAGCSRKAAGPARIVLRAADDHPLGYPTTEALRFMADALRHKTAGRITMEIHPGAQLGSEKETMEMCKLGTLDIDRVSSSPLAEFAPKAGVYSLPYLFRDEAHMWKVLEGPVGREVLGGLEPHGFVGLCYYDSGARSFYNRKRPVRTPADLRGLKIRVQKNRVMQDCVQALGASPVSMAFEEVYSALQTGAVDGAENNPPSYENTKHYEVAKFYSLDEHTRIPEIVLCSKKTWDRLSPADRSLLREAAQASVAEQRRLWTEYTDQAMRTLRQAGVKINTPELAAFRKAAQPVYRQYDAAYGSLVKRIAAAE